MFDSGTLHRPYLCMVRKVRATHRLAIPLFPSQPLLSGESIMAADEAGWAEIRRLYTETAITVTEIATRFAVDRSTIARRANAQRCPPRD